MARKNEYDRYIISASEVGSYVVCPRAWHLAQIKDQRFKETRRAQKGEELHEEWATDYGTAVKLTRQIRMIVSLLLLCILIVMLTSDFGLRP